MSCRARIRRRRWAAVALAVGLWAALEVPGRVAAAAVEAPQDLDGIAASLAGRLAGRKVALPGGGEAPVVGDGEDALLTPERLRRCLDTITRAEAWPAAWLVVQEKQRDFDLVMRVELDEGGAVETPEFLFAVPRREWAIDDMKDVARAATGRKPPRKGLNNLVLQAFSTKVVPSYVYEPVPTGEDAHGLAALLPPGSLIRESRAVELEGAGRFTLALVLRDAVFLPSECADCEAECFGHVDTGSLRLLLVDESEIVDELDLTDELAGESRRLRLPRYPCVAAEAGSYPAIGAFKGREPLTLLAPADLDGDGRALELALPVEPSGCDGYLALTVLVETSPPGLRVGDRRPVAGRPGGSR